FATSHVVAAPQVVCAIVFRQQQPWRPQLRRRDELPYVTTKRRDDRVDDLPRVTFMIGQAKRLYLRYGPQQRLFGFQVPTQPVPHFGRRPLRQEGFFVGADIIPDFLLTEPANDRRRAHSLCDRDDPVENEATNRDIARCTWTTIAITFD